MRFVPWARCLWTLKTRRGLSGGKCCHGSSLRRLRDSNQNRREGLRKWIKRCSRVEAELLENIQGDNPTDWRKKYTEFSSKLVAVRQDFVVNYGDLRETYGSDCANTSRRAEFNDTYVTPFNKRLVVLANKLHS